MINKSVALQPGSESKSFSPKQRIAIEFIALNPSATKKEIANHVGVTDVTIWDWQKNPHFVDAVYETYMTKFGSQLPLVLESMIREAVSGNVQAGRLVLEHSGKLVKNVHVQVDSPFEKFLKSVDAIDAEIVENDDQVVGIIQNLPDPTELPPRKEESQIIRTKNEKESIGSNVKDEIKRQNYNKQQKEWYNWKKRAKAVGVEPLKAKRPTKGQRKAWEDQITAAEKEKSL